MSKYESLVRGTAGAAGSIFAMATTFPLETVKFRMQLNDPHLLNQSTFKSILYILRKEGILQLYKGMKPMLISLGISNFVYFYVFHGVNSLITRRRWKRSARLDLLASMLAGAINVLITSPLWVVNSRLKLRTDNVGDLPVPFNGLITGLIHVAHKEGLAALWASLVADLLLVTNPAIQMTTYEALKRYIPKRKQSAYMFFMVSAMAKLFATLTTYPIQMIQTQQRVGKSNTNVSALHILAAALRSEHPLNVLFHGLEAKLLQTVITAALMFTAYEQITQFIIYGIMLKKK